MQAAKLLFILGAHIEITIHQQLSNHWSIQSNIVTGKHKTLLLHALQGNVTCKQNSKLQYIRIVLLEE
ncbi:unnamed protein product [Paramecium octaurelia]|uniref:Uncharacterized protein n=1 Tax=Paramecium octaurelia TaxID=43137 RepID=A0A8S1WRV6_PAROT|nr:unnamed protein product [Paramecium octaurelia]